MTNENTSNTNFNEMPSDFKPWGMNINQFCMLMHLSQFAGFIFPFGGLILPIIMWQTNKDQSVLVDEHGKNILNWIISCFIYLIISAFLTFLIVGFVTLIATALCSLIFTIIGAIRANNGELYSYPLSIKFFS